MGSLIVARAAPGLALALAACGQGADEATVPPASGAAPIEGAVPEIPVMGPERRIVAFGDSLFAGYGFDEPGEDSYPARLEAALRARGIDARITNAGVSGDTSAAGRQRLDFVLEGLGQKPDLFILELGGNDLLRGLSPEETRANLAGMLDELRKRDIPVLIMGMRAPPNYGPEFQQAFDRIYYDLAGEYDAELVPFWLESIYDKPTLFQNDRIHPTVEGIEALVGATVEDVAEALPEVKAEAAG
ncbi:MAG: arylesterase [Erythrobacter sp.]|jgi:acyl-CoA thioesterase-1|nr:arylesterase [Erythrobacter sp.]